MDVDLFNLEFDSSNTLYSPGENLSGRVVLSTKCKSNVQGALIVVLKGGVYTAWEEGGESEGLEDCELVVNQMQYIIGDAKNDRAIPAGKNYFPFQFTLPPNLASAFSTEFGRVAYEVEAVLRRTNKPDFQVKRPFSVNATVDLNSDIEATKPGELKKSKTAGCLWCASGPISFQLKTPKKGFVSGEALQFECELQNYSRRNISGVTLTLMQTTTYTAQGKKKKVVVPLIESPHPALPPGEVEVWRGHMVRIPIVPPSRLGLLKKNSLISVEYQLRLKMVISNALDLVGFLPVTIGTVPIRNNNDVVSPSMEVSPSAPAAGSSPRGWVQPTTPGDSKGMQRDLPEAGFVNTGGNQPQQTVVLPPNAPPLNGNDRLPPPYSEK